MSPITTHVLDLSTGRPGRDLEVILEQEDTGTWRVLGHGRTDDDGRLRTLSEGHPLSLGLYRLTFRTGAYFERSGTKHFHPEVTIAFRVEDAGAHYHVPLLVSPFGYSTYRGS